MELPAALVQEIRDGNVVLMLGAGASSEASVDGKHPPTGKQLAAQLAERFLGGGYDDYSLSGISELAINENDIVTVQEYIAKSLSLFHQVKLTCCSRASVGEVSRQQITT